MARKKVIDLQADKCVGFGDKPGQKKPGQEVSGYYLGNRKVTTDLGPAVLHVLETENGDNLGVWGSAQLNGKLGQIALGTKVFIIYKKKIKVPKGTMKVFEVEYDDEDVKEGVEQAEVNFKTDSGDSEEESNDESQSDESDEESQDESQGEEMEASEEEEQAPAPKAAPARRPAPQASAVSAQRSAQANALLSKRR